METHRPTPSEVRDPSALRRHCERILKELQELYAESPRKTLDRSIREVQALLARLPKMPPADASHLKAASHVNGQNGTGHATDPEARSVAGPTDPEGSKTRLPA